MEKANQKTVVRLQKRMRKMAKKIKDMDYNLQSIKSVKRQVKYLFTRIDSVKPRSFWARLFQ